MKMVRVLSTVLFWVLFTAFVLGYGEQISTLSHQVQDDHGYMAAQQATIDKDDAAIAEVKGVLGKIQQQLTNRRR